MTKAIITTAIALSDKQRAEIQKSLSTSLSTKTVEIEEVVDPSIIGGIKVRVGSQELDGSLQSKLAAIKAHLVQQL